MTTTTDEPRKHYPMSSRVMTRCQACRQWWPCPTKKAQALAATKEDPAS